MTTLATSAYPQLDRARRISSESAPALRSTELGDPVVGLRNVCLLRLLERVALRFHQAGIPLMVLKGAALNLTLHARPDARAMSDLDLMVHPHDAHRTVEALVDLGCQPGRPLVRADFFPKYHYERDFLTRGVAPMRIDLHVRPFRPLRYARTVPATALWSHAEMVRVGRAEVLVPGVEDMLLHLAVHSAVHGNARPTWLLDLQQWAEHWHRRIDWQAFIDRARDWGLMLAAHAALSRAEATLGTFRPLWASARMAAHIPSRRERLALRQAPQDAQGALRHVLTDVVCTPGLRFGLGYLRAMLLPDRAHLAEWYDHRHPGWLTVARLIRLGSPILRHLPAFWSRVAGTEVRETSRGPGVFARRLFTAGQRVFACTPAAPGKLACTRHSCQPNARRDARGLVALKFIAPGEEVRIDRGLHACDCRRAATDVPGATSANAIDHD